MSFVQKICVITSCTTDFLCEILQRKIKNSFHSCKNKNKFWKASNGFVATNPKTLFWLACLEGNFPSTFSVASLDLLVEIKKAIVIKRLLFCYLFFGLLFRKSSKRFFKSLFVSVSISGSLRFLSSSHSGVTSFLGFLYLFSTHVPVFSGFQANS